MTTLSPLFKVIWSQKLVALLKLFFLSVEIGRVAAISDDQISLLWD